MNKALAFVTDSLETEVSLNRLIFNSVINTVLEERIESQNLPPQQQRLLQYFFKTQTATDKLLKAVFECLDQESVRLLTSKKSLAWKKSELNKLTKPLSSILHKLRLLGKLTPDWEKRFDLIATKIGKQNLSTASDYMQVVKRFHKTSSGKIDSKKILTEDDWIKKWSQLHQASKVDPELFSIGMLLSQEEILFYHLITLFGSVSTLFDLFTKRFRDEFDFSIENIIKGTEIEIVPERIKFENSAVNNELIEILKFYVTRKSVKPLKDFFAGNPANIKIEFLGEKGQLFNLFWLLYQNKMVSRKPKELADLIARSFTLLNSANGPDMNPDRIREALTRKKSPTLFLPEVRKMAHRKKWIM